MHKLLMFRSQLLLLTLLLPFAMWGCQGCKKSKTSTTVESPMHRMLPRAHFGMLIVPQLGQLPNKLNLLLNRFEGKQKPGQAALGQLRRLITESQNALGVDILDAKNLDKHGIDKTGTLLASRIKQGKRKAFVLAVPVSSASSFETLLQNLAKDRFLAKHKEIQKVGSAQVVTLYRKRKQGTTEEFAYTFQNNVALVVRPITSTGPKKGAKAAKTTHGLDALRTLLQLKKDQSLAADTNFLNVLKKWSGKAQAVLYTPPKSKAQPKKAKGKGQKGPSTRPAAKRPVQVRNVPLTQTILKRIRRTNPFSESTTALTFGAEGAQLDAALPLEDSIAKRLSQTVPTSGKAATLLSLLNKRSIASFKLSMNPDSLPKLLARALGSSGARLSPKQLYDMLKKHTGLDLQKDLIPALTGHAMLSLYHVSPRIYQRVQHSPIWLPSMVEIAVVAELRDKKKATKVLNTLAQTLTIGGKKVRTVPTHDKRKQYKIMAFPGAWAHWTIVDNYFIYAIGKTPVKLAVQALRKPKFRLYKKAPEALTANNTMALYVNLPRLMQTFNSLYVPFALKMIVTNFYLLNLKNVEAILLSYQPGEKAIHLQTEVQLKEEKPKKTSGKPAQR
ncbi:MAG: hypothetical protein EP343_29570 [Deltaproteobacteria bacterium]|nr:MAG: hypothetical protein EP343_29570 [Deltaproteobacteria bacterium]